MRHHAIHNGYPWGATILTFILWLLVAALVVSVMARVNRRSYYGTHCSNRMRNRRDEFWTKVDMRIIAAIDEHEDSRHDGAVTYVETEESGERL